jgi:lipoprotein-releasing system permease protein
MLIIDKRKDVETLRNLGADNKLVYRIFLFEGCLISFIGALVGVVLGLVLCLIQQEFGILSLGNGDMAGAFVVDAYPVSVQLGDVCLVLITVLLVSFLSVQYPVRYLFKKL